MARVHETGRFTTPPQASELEALSREAFAMIPRELRGVLGNVVIQVVDFPDDETLDELDCESPFDLLGLYRGVDLTKKSVLEVTPDSDMI